MRTPNLPTEIANSDAWFANRLNTPFSTPISITVSAIAYYRSLISLRTLSIDKTVRTVRTIGDKTVKSEPKNSASQPEVVRSQPRENSHLQILRAGRAA